MSNTRAHITMLTAAMLVAILLAGCTATPKVVTVTEYKERVVHDTVVKIDSILAADSVYQRERERTKGDTVFVERTVEKYKTRWRVKEVENIVEVHVADSIPYEVEVIKEVPAQLNGFQRFIMGSGYGLWAIIACTLFTLITLGILKLRRVISVAK